ncbi:MAG: hypothetical protein LBF90_03425, partial [Prevotellaceae bacterium]|nr:hypothetical protein [Prevotellaceae bacterium]
MNPLTGNRLRGATYSIDMNGLRPIAHCSLVIEISAPPPPAIHHSPFTIHHYYCAIMKATV